MKCLILSKILIAKETCALWYIPRQKSGNLCLQNDSECPFVSPLSAERWLQSPEVVIHTAWVTRCSGKKCHEAQPWLTLLFFSVWWYLGGGPQWKRKDVDCGSEDKLRATTQTDSDGPMEHDYWSQQPWKYHYYLQNPHVFILLIRKLEVRGTFAYNVHQYIHLNRKEAILRIWKAFQDICFQGQITGTEILFRVGLF